MTESQASADAAKPTLSQTRSTWSPRWVRAG